MLMKDFADHGIDSKTGFGNPLTHSLKSLEFNRSNLLAALIDTPLGFDIIEQVIEYGDSRGGRTQCKTSMRQ